MSRFWYDDVDWDAAMAAVRERRARVIGPLPTRERLDYSQIHTVNDLPHYVYRIYDEAGSLLYIGCTRDLVTRITQHISGSPFTTRMTYWTGWRYPNRWAALDAEAAAIGDEDPAFNVHHRRPYVWPDFSETTPSPAPSRVGVTPVAGTGRPSAPGGAL